MKRFLATLSVMAMIVSMFSGVVLADPVWTLELDNDEITFVEGFYYGTITGRAVNEDGVPVNVDVTMELWEKDGVQITEGVTGLNINDGFFAVNVLTNLGVGTYTLVADGVEADFTIMYATELVEPTTLEWTWGDIPDTVIVQGMFPNEDNMFDAEAITLAYTDGTEIGAADFANDSVFGFLFSGDDLVQTGELGLYINGTLALEGEVFTNEMAVTIDPMEAMVNLGDVTLTAEFDFADAYTNELDLNHAGNNLAPGYTLTVAVTDSDGNVELPESEVNYEFGRVTANQLIETINLNGFTVDIYTFEFKLYYTDFIIEEATVDVEALEPDDYNLVGWNDDPLNVGNNDFTFNSSSAERPVRVLNQDGNIAPNIISSLYYEVTFNGAGLEDKVVKSYDDGSYVTNFEIAPTETGTVEVIINVYDDSDMESDDLVATFTRELAVEGWNVTVTPNVVDVDSEQDITVTITDEDGNPINNAIISDDYSGLLFDGTTTNVVGGVYVIEYDDDAWPFDTVGTLPMAFYTEDGWDDTGIPEVTLLDAIEVVGLEVYSVISGTSTLLEGFSEEIVITPLDADGDVIYPTIDVTYYDADGDKIGTTVEGVSQTRVDTNDDGVKESVEIDLTPVAGAASALVNASTDSDKYFGEVELEVVKPQIVMTGANTLTAFIETDFEFTVIDPRDGSLLDNDVDYDYDSNYLCCILEEASDEDDGVFTFTLLTDEVWFAGAEEDEEDIFFEFYMNADDDIDVTLAEIQVVAPSFTADPAQLIIGTSSNIVLTYLDAEGNPLEGYDVYLGEFFNDYDAGDFSAKGAEPHGFEYYIDGELIGTTDENGQIAYATIAGNTGGLNFIALTDEDDDYSMVECHVPVVIDMEAPTATLVEANGMATITITDNVRVTKAMVNGELVDMFYAAPTVVHMTAKADQYHVQAIDANFNYLMITLEGASVNMLVVTVGEDTGFGPAELIEGTTMVPVRYAEELGAVVTWDDATESVTYTINGGEVVITVQIGNTTAMVNGVAMEMAVAPYINAQNRTMVPLRMIAQELGFTVNYIGGGVTQIQ